MAFVGTHPNVQQNAYAYTSAIIRRISSTTTQILPNKPSLRRIIKKNKLASFPLLFSELLHCGCGTAGIESSQEGAEQECKHSAVISEYESLDPPGHP